jgi:hypothetical protein
MKSYLIACFLFLTYLAVSAQETPVSSTIQGVVVYSKGAQVTRAAEARLQAGENTLVLTGLTPQLNPQSIQVKGEGTQAFTLLSVNHRYHFGDTLQKSAERTALNERIDSLELLIRRENVRLETLKNEYELILANQKLGGQQQGVSVAELERAADFFRERLTRIKAEELDVQLQQQKWKEAVTKAKRQLGELSSGGAADRTLEVVLKIKSDQAQTAQLSLSYLSAQARWYPTYDIRVRDVSSPADLTYKANIQQSSGEDWGKVQLTLSTADPFRSANKPVLQPWRLGYAPSAAYRPAAPSVQIMPGGQDPNILQGVVLDEYGEPLIGVNLIIAGTSTGTVTDMDGRFSLPVPAYGQVRIQVHYVGYQAQEFMATGGNFVNVRLGASDMMLEEVVVTGYGKRRRDEAEMAPPPPPVAAAAPVVEQVENTTSFEFQIALPYSVPSDNKPYTVEIDQFPLPASYEYYCAPKMDPSAFLTARLTDWEEYRLLNGEASLFFEGTYIGKAFINAEQTEDTLSLSLGRDGNIVVQRNKQKQLSSRQFIGSKQQQVAGWEIEIRNKKAQAVSIVIEDQFPVSTEKDIDVSLDNHNATEVAVAAGKLIWRLDLSANKQEKLQFQYTVKYPKGVRLDL